MDSLGEGGDVRRTTILVTGATGFIGSRLIQRFLGRPDVRVVAFARDSSNTTLLPPGVEVRRGALDREDSLAAVVEGIDVVVHLAADMDFYPAGPARKNELLATNVVGTLHLTRAFGKAHGTSRRTRSSRRGRFVYVSSTEVYGDVTDPPATERSPVQPVYEYGKSKVHAEEVVRRVSADMGFDHVIARPTGVMGPGDTFAIWELLNMINWGLLCFIPGSGAALLMFTHVDDVVEGLIRCATRPEAKNEDFIICPNDALSYKEWIDCISSIVGRLRPVVHLPIWFVRLGTRLLALVMNRGKARIFMYHPNTIDRMARDRSFSNAKAKRLLGFEPAYTIAGALSETVDHHFERGSMRKYLVNPILFCVVVTVIGCSTLAFALQPLR